MTELTVEQQIAAQAEVDLKTHGESPSMTAEQYREQGAQALAKNEMETAIDFFSKALQAKIAETGNELDSECATYYFDYGDAMLQQCSQKSDVFGGAIKQAQKQVAVEMIEETKNEEGDDDEEKEAGANETENDDVANEKETADNEPATENADVKEVDEDVAEREEANEPEDEEDEEEGDAAEEDIEDTDNPTDLEVAWELLETARVIFSRMDKKEPSALFGLADCYSRLGDLALENDTDAIADYTNCLSTLSSITDEESLSSSQLQIKNRALGAVNFKMAIANSLTGESSSALSQFQDAQKFLLNVAELILGRSLTSSGKSEAGSEAIPIAAIKEAASSLDEKRSSEVNDLVDLLQKIQEKIEDLLVAEPMKSTEVTSIVNEIMADAAAAAGVSNGFEPSRDSAGDSNEINDLGTIVGQKRKIAEETEVEQPTKVAKPDDI